MRNTYVFYLHKSSSYTQVLPEFSFYSTLRDAVKPDETGAAPCKTMSHLALMELTWTSSESNLVTMVNDPLLFPKMRRHALFQLKKRLDWPATNKIPEP